MRPARIGEIRLQPHANRDHLAAGGGVALHCPLNQLSKGRFCLGKICFGPCVAKRWHRQPVIERSHDRSRATRNHQWSCILRFGNAENRARELAIGADFLETLPAEPQQIPRQDPRREWMMALV